MNPVWLPWLEFAPCVVLIAAAGPVLVRSGNAIARLTGLSGSWIGLVLPATATSLPKLITGGTIGWVSLSLLIVYLFSSYTIYLERH